MKKILALILAAGLMLCACGGEPATAKLSVDATSVTPTGLEYTLTIEGKGELENVGDGDYYIEKNSGGAWSRVNAVTQPVPTAGFTSSIKPSRSTAKASHSRPISR